MNTNISPRRDVGRNRLSRLIRNLLLLIGSMVALWWLVGGRAMTWNMTLESTADAPRMFRCLTEPALITRWVGGVVEVESLSSQFGEGARARFVVERRGRRSEWWGEVTEFEQDRLLAIRLSGPTSEITDTYPYRVSGALQSPAATKAGSAQGHLSIHFAVYRPNATAQAGGRL